jgi:hypothetical protein
VRGGTRIGSAAVVLAVLGTIVVTPATSRAVNTLPGPCSLQRLDGESVQHLSARRVRCAVRVYGPVRGGADRAVCIAARESGLDPRASSATGMYLGLFQHDAIAWPNRYRTWTDPIWNLSTSALSGRTNAIVTIRMVRTAGGWRAAGWPRRGC